MELRETRAIRDLRKSPLGQNIMNRKWIFLLFIEHGIDLLKTKGKLGFIVMQYWMSKHTQKY